MVICTSRCSFIIIHFDHTVDHTGIFLFSIFERLDAPRYLKISLYAAALISLPLILFFWGIMPKGHNLQASNTYCETYIDGSLTSCGLVTKSLALIGSILIVFMIVSIKNLIFLKEEMQ